MGRPGGRRAPGHIEQLPFSVVQRDATTDGIEFRAFEDARVRVMTEENVVMHDMFGAANTSPNPTSTPAGPQAYLAELGPGFVEHAHFHNVDQFQVFFGGGDAFFQRHSVSKMLLQYADAFATYGPFGAGETTLGLYTLRSRASGLRAYMPQDRDKMTHRGLRQRSVDLVSYVERVPGPSPVIEAVLPPEQDGLAAYWIDLPPGADATAPEADGAGQFHCVVSGSVQAGGQTFGPMSLGWIAAGPATPTVGFRCASDGPASVLVLQLPHPTVPLD